MAKRSSHTSQRKTAVRPQARPKADELDDRSDQLEGVAEFDPDSLESVQKMSPQSLAVEASEGTIEVSDDLYAAREAMLDFLGGHVAMVQARAVTVQAGQSFGLENILGVGIGMKEVAGGVTGELAVKVFVREKVASRRISEATSIPEEMDGVPTDIEPTGALKNFSYAAEYPRPVPCGVSCGHLDITSGTVGALVVLRNNRLAILSNNHVLANENHAALGDRIVQPGPLDGGTPAHMIGILESFTPISFSDINLIDGAVAFTSRQLVSSRHVTYALNPEPTAAAPMMTVMKNGRTTRSTAGWVSAVSVDGVAVEYDGGIATFNDQVIIRSLTQNPFSQPGDSGSLIVTTGSRRPVGLLFAGSASHTIANPITNVMSLLGIERFVGG